MRVRCDRPGGYTAFAVPIGVRGVRWCGREIGPGVLLRVEEPWEISTPGPFDNLAFAVDRAALEAVEAQLTGGEEVARAANAVLEGTSAGALAPRLRHLLRLLGSVCSQPDAQRFVSEHLLHLAARLNRPRGWAGVGGLAPPSRRRAAVRRVEEYLDVHRSEVVPVPTLCAVAGVSERTLEYAFREHLGMPLVRYQRIRRLNRAHRALRDPQSEDAQVTTIAMAAGFVDLSRFACDYRALFGERPSETLRRAMPPRRGGSQQALDRLP
jgi:AraC family ethanolamine operon transcriptional activator